MPTTNSTQSPTQRSTKADNRPWLLVLLNCGAIVTTVAQIRHLWLMVGAS